MVNHIIHADILLIVRIFPRPYGARKNTTQLAKYPRVLYVKPSNKMNLFLVVFCFIFNLVVVVPNLQIFWTLDTMSTHSPGSFRELSCDLRYTEETNGAVT